MTHPHSNHLPRPAHLRAAALASLALFLVGCAAPEVNNTHGLPQEKRTRTTPHAIPFAVAPDDSRLALAVSRGTEVTVVNLETGHSQAWDLPAGVHHFIPKEWDPRSTRIAGVWATRDSDDGGIAVLDADTGHLRKLTERATGSLADWWPTWSPSGRWIAFERHEETAGAASSTLSLFVVPAEGGSPARVNSRGDDVGPSRHGKFSWDASSDVMYFVARPTDGPPKNELCIVPVGPNGPGPLRRMAIEQLGPPENLASVRVVRSPMAEIAVLAADWLGTGQQCWLLSTDLNAPPRLLLEDIPTIFYSPLRLVDGNRLIALRYVYEDGDWLHVATTEPPTELAEVDTMTGDTRVLLTHQLGGGRFALSSVSRSGKFLYWCDQEAGTLARTSVSEWKPEVLYGPMI